MEREIEKLEREKTAWKRSINFAIAILALFASFLVGYWTSLEDHYVEVESRYAKAIEAERACQELRETLNGGK